METLDTNVVVRAAVKDDDPQCRDAEVVWNVALARGGVYLTKVVLAETVWVLRSAYRLRKEEIAAILGRLVEIAGVVLEDDEVARRALASFEVGGADLADYLILESARKAGALPVRTFDCGLAEEDDVELASSGDTR